MSSCSAKGIVPQAVTGASIEYQRLIIYLTPPAPNPHPQIRALAVYADAYMFSCSAKGIVQQAVTGASIEYQRLANALRDHPAHDSCVGCCFLGGLYAVAPWPVGNKELSAK
jgi:hypothetical protein